jgi:hypothetical protein
MKKDEFGIEMFETVIDVLWDNRQQCVEDYYFDFPEYGGLPKAICNQLRSDTVDVIQEIYDSYHMRDFKTKNQFRNYFKDSLFLMSK